MVTQIKTINRITYMRFVTRLTMMYSNMVLVMTLLMKMDILIA